MITIIRRLPDDDPQDVVTESDRHKNIRFLIMDEHGDHYAKVLNGDITFYPVNKSALQ